MTSVIAKNKEKEKKKKDKNIKDLKKEFGWQFGGQKYGGM
jgi:hypothetical protein